MCKKPLKIFEWKCEFSLMLCGVVGEARAVHLAPHWLQVRSRLMASLPRLERPPRNTLRISSWRVVPFGRYGRTETRVSFVSPFHLLYLYILVSLSLGHPCAMGWKRMVIVRLQLASLIDCAYRCLQWNAGSLFFPMALTVLHSFY